MSRHLIEQDGTTYAVGWDPPCETFFVQDDNEESMGIGVWHRELYDLDALEQACLKNYGLILPSDLLGQLYLDRDLGR